MSIRPASAVRNDMETRRMDNIAGVFARSIEEAARRGKRVYECRYNGLEKREDVVKALRNYGYRASFERRGNGSVLVIRW